MASRQETQKKKTSLLVHLRMFCDQNRVTGGALPSIRSLASQFGVSVGVVHSVLKTLQEEGLIEASKGAGTVVNVQRFSEEEVYLYLGERLINLGGFWQPDASLAGMTDRLAELGAFTFALSSVEELKKTSLQTILRCKGLYGSLYDHHSQQRKHPPVPMPTASFDEHADPELDDCVRFSDIEGGKLATQHLLSLGHRSILYLGRFDVPLGWAARRSEGYRQAMVEAGWQERVQVVDFGAGVSYLDAPQIAYEAAKDILAGPIPDAVVASNDEVAVALLRSACDLGVPLRDWPAVIGFDDEGIFGGQSISSMRQDRRAVGRAAADLLWERSHGLLTGPPVVREIPMTLVPRLSSQRGWAYRLSRLIEGFPFIESAPPAAVRPS